MRVGRFTPEHIKNSFLKNFLIYLGIPVGVVLCILMLRCSADQWYLTLCDPVYYSPSGSSVCGILQARILEWVGISSSRVSSWLRNQTHVSCISRQILYHWTAQEAPVILWYYFICPLNSSLEFIHDRKTYLRIKEIDCHCDLVDDHSLSLSLYVCICLCIYVCIIIFKYNVPDGWVSVTNRSLHMYMLFSLVFFSTYFVRSYCFRGFLFLSLPLCALW